MFRFETLDIWQEASDFVGDIYKISKSWPRSEVFGLMSQTRRSVVSIPANIAEGSAATSIKDYKRYMDIARKSLFETVSHLLVAEKQGYIKKVERVELYRKADILSRKIFTFKKSLR